MYNIGLGTGHHAVAGCVCICSEVVGTQAGGSIANVAWIPLVLGGMMITANTISILKLRYGEKVYEKLRRRDLP